jgi:hypothetical protein
MAMASVCWAKAQQLEGMAATYAKLALGNQKNDFVVLQPDLDTSLVSAS